MRRTVRRKTSGLPGVGYRSCAFSETRNPKTEARFFGILLATLLIGGCAGRHEANARGKITRPGPASMPVFETEKTPSMTVVQHNVVLFAAVPGRTDMGEPVIATVILKNVGKRPTRGGYFVPTERNFLISVEDEDGQSVARIKPPKPATQPADGDQAEEEQFSPESVRGLMLLPSMLPGEAITAKYELQKIFHLEAPGRYHFLAASNMAGEVPDDQPVIVRVPFAIVRP